MDKFEPTVVLKQCNNGMSFFSQRDSTEAAWAESQISLGVTLHGIVSWPWC